MAKDCGNHEEEEFRSLCRGLFAILLGLIVLVLIVVFIVWLVLRPTHPRFYLQDAVIRQLEVGNGTADIVTIAIQATVASRNPNARIGVYYDRLDAYATYKYQQVTVPAMLPPVYQGHGDVDVWSPVLAGDSVPVAPYLATALSQDCAAGYLIVQIKLDGRVRFKVGSWVSGHYHLFVTCPAFLVGGSTGANAGGFRFQQATECSVDV